ncbi:radical SAM protein [Algimonas ampicilliniresistens]|uniref:Radical SAM protein n=1 Tax=Algimonas ampicilliniresistens TaxID=1298735 RepID=A0ABQ5V7N2_9PROT|nr:PA0069 family radical SAM protein [Algimonas ampicilliniresistens]GLQ22868.1 radical SAM protein [Algimonas ampicilliniresistens]
MAQPNILPFQQPKRELKIREKGRGARSNVTGRYEPLTRERSEEDWDALPIEDRAPAKTSLTVEFPRTIINKVVSPYVGFERSINPYRGCEHGCIYCFARPTHTYYGLSAGLDFETRLYAKPSGPELLKRELSNPRYKVRPIMIGTNTDAYQPVEREQLIMRGLLQVLSDFRHPVSILTKSNLITRDLDILGPMAERGIARAMVSITTQDRALARAMEPRCPTPERRFEALGQLAAAGIPTGIMLGPMIPGLNDSELESIMTRAAELGASYSAYTVLRLPQEVSPIFQEWLEAFAPTRARRIMNHIRTINGGKDYDPHWSRGEDSEVKTPFRKLIAQRYYHAQRRTGIIPREQRVSLDCTQFRVPERVSGQGDLFG